MKRRQIIFIGVCTMVVFFSGHVRSARAEVLTLSQGLQRVAENNRVRYEEGVGTATEVLDAVTLLTVAETNYYRSLYDLRRAESATLYSMGKDLPEVYK